MLNKDFNPRPREEGDLGLYSIDIVLCDFNPRPREEGDRYNDVYIDGAGHFNPRPREEGDTEVSSMCLIVYGFQSTPS